MSKTRFIPRFGDLERRMDQTSKSTTSTLERRPPLGRVALVWRGDPDAGVPEPATTRHHLIFSALAALGIAAEPVLYAEEVGGRSARPPSRNGRRAGLGRSAERRQGPLAARSAAAGHRVPRRVGERPSGRDFEDGRQGGLYRTRALGWGTDTDLYLSAQDFDARFPARLAAGGPRVLKQNRGNGGQGVWKVELVGRAAGTARRTRPSASCTRCAAASRKSSRSAIS